MVALPLVLPTMKIPNPVRMMPVRPFIRKYFDVRRLSIMQTRQYGTDSIAAVFFRSRSPHSTVAKKSEVFLRNPCDQSGGRDIDSRLY